MKPGADPKSVGGGAVRFTPDAKSGWEGGVLSASGPIQKVGGGGRRQLVPEGGISYRAAAPPPKAYAGSGAAQGRIAPCSGLQPQYMCQSLRPHAGTPHGIMQEVS